jgi:hypothetical protein
VIIVCALYGMRSSGAAFWSLPANQLYDIGYKSTKGDPDVWIHTAVKGDGFENCEVVLAYVHDIYVLYLTSL